MKLSQFVLPLALSAVLPAAYAAPTLSPVNNLVIPATTAGLYINVVTGASSSTPASAPGWDLNPWGSGSMFVYQATGGGIVTSAASALANLAPGSVVGASSTFATNTVATFGSTAGQWALNTTNYFGFSFIGEDAQLHYGYGSMIMGASATVRTLGQIWYESTPGASITLAVPEVSTTAMMLVGGALMAGMGLRRRRIAGA